MRAELIVTALGTNASLVEMKRVTDKELQHNTEELLGHVVTGETLAITVEERLVAKLVPRGWMTQADRVKLLEALAAELSERRSEPS